MDNEQEKFIAEIETAMDKFDIEVIQYLLDIINERITALIAQKEALEDVT